MVKYHVCGYSGIMLIDMNTIEYVIRLEIYMYAFKSNCNVECISRCWCYYKYHKIFFIALYKNKGGWYSKIIMVTCKNNWMLATTSLNHVSTWLLVLFRPLSVNWVKGLLLALELI